MYILTSALSSDNERKHTEHMNVWCYHETFLLSAMPLTSSLILLKAEIREGQWLRLSPKWKKVLMGTLWVSSTAGPPSTVQWALTAKQLGNQEGGCDGIDHTNTIQELRITSSRRMYECYLGWCGLYIQCE